ncbi:M66 family metalloprotease [Photobacterium aphoticum]|uniref:Carbohydrate-binding protein n=1 Tax=Photobacterium aphoticum TaxID=754436 RepID=A0A0J1GI46_9GAMM|nr:M66 family metalloprotease [Photobacterium aphoticum]KLU99173.1 carbohydrate-binding protein [Photobacterium aphoticum]PSU59038.1 DUF5011 domain-containing protein [Photobacterium aphoticum]GHA45016.1 hypothetical protein GCM10007086_18170 [Photobacterium aphoticum]
MKKTYIACLIPALLAAGSAFATPSSATDIHYFSQKALPSDTQGRLLGSVNMAQSIIMPTVHQVQDDRQPHLVALRKTLVIFEPQDETFSLTTPITLTAKNSQGEVVHQSVMSLPSQLPKVAGQRDDLNITIEKPAQFDHKVAGNGPLGSIADAQGQAAFAQLLAEHDTIQVETADGSWAQNFILPEGEAFHGKRVTFTSYAGYNSFITYSTGTDTLSAGNEFTYKNQKGKWFAQSDIDIKNVAYSDKAYTAILPAEAVQPGLTLTFSTVNGQEGVLNAVKIGASTHFVLNAVDIGLLTPPREQFAFVMDRELQRQYFQNLQISKLTVNPYEPIYFAEVMLPNGRLLQDYDPSKADGYGSDSHYWVARELVSAGINSANYGVNSSSVRPHAAWNINNPYHAAQVTVNMSVGKYTDGNIVHGMLGSYAGVASVANSTGNEFSHEIGHELGAGSHYLGGFLGAVHNRSTERNSAWGWDEKHNNFLPNFTKAITNTPMCYEGQCAEPFAGHGFGTGTMSGGWPMYPQHNAYTLHVPYELSVFQDFMTQKANFDLASPTGFSKWNSDSQQMEPWENRVADDLAFEIKQIADNNSLHLFGPESTELHTIYSQFDAIRFSLGNGDWARDLYLLDDAAFEGKVAQFQSWAGWTAYVHVNGTTRALKTNEKFAYQFTNGAWVEVESDVLDKTIALTPVKQGVPVTTLVGYYDPENTLPSYIYPALHGAYGSVYEDAFSPSSCQLSVKTREAGTLTYNLYNRRLTSDMMNRFHINVETALQPYEAQVMCEGEVLDTAALEAPKQSLSATVITTQAGEAPTILGADDVVIAQGEAFDPRQGVSATDDFDGDVTASLVIEGQVDNQKAGVYTLTYKAYDSAQSETVVTRTVEVFSEKPVLAGIEDVTVDLGAAFDVMNGVSAHDVEDGDLSAVVLVSGNVDVNNAGTYVLVYQVTDSAGQTVTAERIVTVEGCENMWSAQAIYVAGDHVSHNGAVWLAGWWTQGEEPGTTGEWGVWKQVADNGCSAPKPEVTPPPPGEYPAYQAGTAYQEGDIVKGTDNNLYQCKPWPNSGWCASAAYAPGTSAYWQDAWNKL